LSAVSSILRMFLLTAIQFSSIDSFPSVTAGLLDYFKLTNRFRLSSEQSISLLGNFDLFSDSQRMTEAEREYFGMASKHEIWKIFLSTLVRQVPSLFAGRWPAIFDAIFASGDECDLSPSFAAALDADSLADILRALLACANFPIDFLIDFLVANMSRFDLVWSLFLTNTAVGSSRDSDEELLSLWLGLMEKSFIDITQSALLKFGADLICKSVHLLRTEKLSILQTVRAVLVANSLAVDWPAVFQILNPVNFTDDTELIVESYSLTNLFPLDDRQFVTDFLSLILQFAANRAAINVSLSSFDLLWQIKVSLDSDTWISLLNRVATLFLDDRFDVAHAAVKTFFSILSSNAGRIPATVTSSYLTTGWPRLLRDDALLACGSVFVVLLQELSHHVCSYWDQFDADALREQFLPFFIRVSETFIRDSAIKETVIEGYQVYGYFLTLPRPPLDTQLAWLGSLKALCYEKFKFEADLNSSLLSHLGRFMCNVIRSFAGRRESVPYAEWLRLVTDMALSFDGDEFVHITPQRAMDGFVGLFPLAEPYASMTIAAFVEMFVRTDQQPLMQNVSDDLAQCLKSCAHGSWTWHSISENRRGRRPRIVTARSLGGTQRSRRRRRSGSTRSQPRLCE
jgi:hypothetical protein